MKLPRIGISAFKGGSGKTIISLGIVANLLSLGKKPITFKKGPDYIDSNWLSFASNQKCYNLDAFLCSKEDIIKSFIFHAQQGKISLIEGNRGLFDGIDVEGKNSTANLAKTLKLPIIMCVDCTKCTRTITPMLAGCMNFDKEVQIKGVILNKVAGERHANIIKNTIKNNLDIEILGSIPKKIQNFFPERHMGLIPNFEHREAIGAIKSIETVIKDYIDIEKIIQLANNAEDFKEEDKSPIFLPSCKSEKIKIAVAQDEAFQFYYPDNIEALEAQGAKIVFISPLHSQNIDDDICALYIGGGFPETGVKLLSKNIAFKKKLKSMIEKELPVYAECGGLLYLSKELIDKDKKYEMLDVFPISFDFAKKPQAHGYTKLEIKDENPFFEKGTKIKGHEFRYSRIFDKKNFKMCAEVIRGKGICDNKDCAIYKNVFATYTHSHALGFKKWAEAILKKAKEYKVTKR